MAACSYVAGWSPTCSASISKHHAVCHGIDDACRVEQVGNCERRAAMEGTVSVVWVARDGAPLLTTWHLVWPQASTGHAAANIDDVSNHGGVCVAVGMGNGQSQ